MNQKVSFWHSSMTYGQRDETSWKCGNALLLEIVNDVAIAFFDDLLGNQNFK
ncbi:hypothetical protein [Pseudanabaena sp. ABRG5-3]|uniref:hypothetical protein n=1 Tax=Pseudanabaena sp. ABRG5-3 TaxID=685565 RepID=UPI0013A66AC5|nr:hypothetical protein [Pseudanabaena sp. ABRG5-3]